MPAVTELRRVEPMQPGQYSRRASGSVAISCPCCGFVWHLDWPYRVSNEGTVRPKWLCERCNWTGDLKLVDYGEAVLT